MGQFMTRAELNETIAEFEKEEAIWQKLRIGQILFMESGNGWDFDYFAHEIVSIDAESRQIVYSDLSQGSKIVTMGRLSTIKELAERKILPVQIDTTGYTELQIGIV
jgi:hypothetical protein